VHRWLLFHAGVRPALAALDKLEAGARVTIEFATLEHHLAARRWLERLVDQRISYTDAVSFAVMQARRCRTALAFDHDFVVAGFELWRSG
jgi:predicted nucleic acid-binding protein